MPKKRKSQSDHNVGVKKAKLEHQTTTNKQNNSVDRGKGNERCKNCFQFLDVVVQVSRPVGVDMSLEEAVMLTFPELALDAENSEYEADHTPTHKITGFSVYDSDGHLCYLDEGLLERDKSLFVSGYVKPIHCDDPSIEQGIPIMGVELEEWWSYNAGVGDKAIIGFSSALADYYIMDASEEYEPYIATAREKVYIAKCVEDYVKDNDACTYDEFINGIESMEQSITEETVLNHAPYILSKLAELDEIGSKDDVKLLNSRCLSRLIKLTGWTPDKKKSIKKPDARGSRRRMTEETVKKKPAPVKERTITNLVRDVIGQLFTITGPPPECKCAACKLKNCGTCYACKQMAKGSSTHTMCLNKFCENIAEKLADHDNVESDDDDNDFHQNGNKSSSGREAAKKLFTKTLNDVSWVSKPFLEKGGMKFYESAEFGKETFTAGDYVIISPDLCDLVKPNEIGKLKLFARIEYLFEKSSGKKFAHGRFLIRAFDTILGETGDKWELFMLDQCADLTFADIYKRANISIKSRPVRWLPDGLPESTEYFYSKRFIPRTCRFEDLTPTDKAAKNAKKATYCKICEKDEETELEKTALIGNILREKIFRSVLWERVSYNLEDCVFVYPEFVKFAIKPRVAPPRAKEEKVDEDLYPEKYRKSNDYNRGQNITDLRPFVIGRVTEIVPKKAAKCGSRCSPDDVLLTIGLFYRPEDTHRGLSESYESDLNMLYWSEEMVTVKLSSVAGKCHVVYLDDSDDKESFRKAGPHRFYFTKWYDSNDKQFVEAPKGVIKYFSNKKKSLSDYPEVDKKLKMLDVFAGCGGLSLGFHQAGLADTEWAIEFDPDAAEAFKKNNPKCTVFTEDCNEFLKAAMNGEAKLKGRLLPKPGEVDIIVGGPPCQGFSGMNRFNKGQYSLFQNSLVATYVSFCDFYRPKYFLLENVRNFVSFKKGRILKMILSCLLRMGYQCTFGILQAGCYGVPQTRRRVFIIAAAPGEKLPSFPEPDNVFFSRGSNAGLNVAVDNREYVNDLRWAAYGPYRAITVRDSMSDLPNIKNGADQAKMKYASSPKSHFQRMMREDFGSESEALCDHICKQMSLLCVKRFEHVPTLPGSDWRDLPNIELTLSDGRRIRRLRYTHKDVKNGKSKTGALRGVCSCAAGGKCDRAFIQGDTLIPWCLPHTSNRHAQWAGLYGRLDPDGFFCTTVTNPEPMGKQGLVVHPNQHRVVSVRECARSQGFPDTYKFHGPILNRHRQIGNAVPPPMAAAIGRAIVHSRMTSTNN